MNVRFLIKSTCPDSHFHMLFMLKFYDEIRQGYKSKYVFHDNQSRIMFIHENLNLV